MNVIGRPKGWWVVLLSRVRTSALVTLLVVLALSLTACSASRMGFVDDGNSYDAESIESLQVTVGKPSVEGSPVSEASDLRRDALIELRSYGALGSELAEFVTSTLPDNGRSVPYYGEAARFGGIDAWVLIEAWGTAGGALDHSRIWVFDRTSGDVLYSSAQ